MKNLNTIRALSFLFMIMFTANIAYSKPVSADIVIDSLPMELHLLKNYLNFPAPGLDKISYKFFDSEDNLVYEAIVQIGEIKEKRLVKYLNESDLLTEVRGSKIHRLK